MIQNNSSATLKFSIYLNAMVFGGYLLLLVAYLIHPSSLYKTPDNLEFMPVFVIGFAFLYIAFTCGELFGHLNHPALLYGQSALIKPARRSLTLFLFSIIFFYFLRSGFQEDFFQKLALILMPAGIFIYLFYFIYVFYSLKIFQRDYMILKMILLGLAAFSSLISLFKLFFPDKLEKILSLF